MTSKQLYETAQAVNDNSFGIDVLPMLDTLAKYITENSLQGTELAKDLMDCRTEFDTNDISPQDAIDTLAMYICSLLIMVKGISTWKQQHKVLYYTVHNADGKALGTYAAQADNIRPTLSEDAADGYQMQFSVSGEPTDDQEYLRQSTLHVTVWIESLGEVYGKSFKDILQNIKVGFLLYVEAMHNVAGDPLKAVDDASWRELHYTTFDNLNKDLLAEISRK